MRTATASVSPNLHSGHPTATKQPSGSVLVFCPEGHLMAAVRSQDWTGSPWEKRVNDPTFVADCAGARR
jgi:hypothetical protein